MKEYRYILVAKSEEFIGGWISLEGKTIQDLLEVENLCKENGFDYQIEWR